MGGHRHNQQQLLKNQWAAALERGGVQYSQQPRGVLQNEEEAGLWLFAGASAAETAPLSFEWRGDNHSGDQQQQQQQHQQVPRALTSGQCSTFAAADVRRALRVLSCGPRRGSAVAAAAAAIERAASVQKAAEEAASSERRKFKSTTAAPCASGVLKLRGSNSRMAAWRQLKAQRITSARQFAGNCPLAVECELPPGGAHGEPTAAEAAVESGVREEQQVAPADTQLKHLRFQAATHPQSPVQLEEAIEQFEGPPPSDGCLGGTTSPLVAATERQQKQQHPHPQARVEPHNKELKELSCSGKKIYSTGKTGRSGAIRIIKRSLLARRQQQQLKASSEEVTSNTINSSRSEGSEQAHTVKGEIVRSLSGGNLQRSLLSASETAPLERGNNKKEMMQSACSLAMQLDNSNHHHQQQHYSSNNLDKNHQEEEEEPGRQLDEDEGSVGFGNRAHHQQSMGSLTGASSTATATVAAMAAAAAHNGDSNKNNGPSNKIGRLFGKKAARFKEIVLQNLGRADRTSDELFDAHEENFFRQHAQANKLAKELANYVSSLKGFQETSRSLSGCIQQATSDYQGARHDLVCENLSHLNELNGDYMEKLREQVAEYVHEHLSQFSELKEKIAKRHRKLIDYDSSRRVYELAHAQVTKKRLKQQQQAAAAAAEGANQEQGAAGHRQQSEHEHQQQEGSLQISRGLRFLSQQQQQQQQQQQLGHSLESGDSLNQHHLSQELVASHLVDEARLLKLREQCNYCKLMFESINCELHEELPLIYERKMKNLLATLQSYFALEAHYHSNAGKLMATASDVVDEFPATTAASGGNLSISGATAAGAVRQHGPGLAPPLPPPVMSQAHGLQQSAAVAAAAAAAAAKKSNGGFDAKLASLDGTTNNSCATSNDELFNDDDDDVGEEEIAAAGATRTAMNGRDEEGSNNNNKGQEEEEDEEEGLGGRRHPMARANGSTSALGSSGMGDSSCLDSASSNAGSPDSGARNGNGGPQAELAPAEVVMPAEHSAINGEGGAESGKEVEPALVGHRAVGDNHQQEAAAAAAVATAGEPLERSSGGGCSAVATAGAAVVAVVACANQEETSECPRQRETSASSDRLDSSEPTAAALIVGGGGDDDGGQFFHEELLAAAAAISESDPQMAATVESLSAPLSASGRVDLVEEESKATQRGQMEVEEKVEAKANEESENNNNCLYKVKTNYKYLAEDVDELCFEADELIQVVAVDDPNHEPEEGWLMGVRELNGQRGLFPANFTRPI